MVWGAGEARADQVFLKNGDRISGTVIDHKNPDGLFLATGYGADLRIPWAEIDALSPAYPVPKASDPLQEAALLPITAEEAAQIEPASASASAGLTAPPEEGEKTKWTGAANLSAALKDGNSNSRELAADARIKARDAQNRYLFGGKYHYAEDEDSVSSDETTLFAEYDRFLTEKWFLGGRLRFEMDDVAQLDLRSRAGLFSGYQFYERDDLALQVKGGLEYIRESYANADTNDHIALSFATDYEQAFMDDAFRLFHRHSLSVPADEIEAFLLNSESGVKVPVGTFLTGTAEIDYDYENRPAPGAEKDDTVYLLKLGYEW